MRNQSHMRPILWIASSKKDLRKMPIEVQKEMGHALRELQKGKDPGNSKPLKHLHEPISEIMVDESEETFRTVYTVEFKDAIAVLHVFHKKSKSGVATPKKEIRLMIQRLKQARVDYHEWRQEP
jgi:phage-related protein